MPELRGRWVDWLWRAALWGCAAAVFALAVMPINGLVPSTGWDKRDHLLAFFVMGLLALRAYPARRHRCVAALLGYGVLIELVQALLPYRFAEWRDVVADAAGVALALGAFTVQLGIARYRLGRQAAGRG